MTLDKIFSVGNTILLGTALGVYMFALITGNIPLIIMIISGTVAGTLTYSLLKSVNHIQCIWDAHATWG